MKAALLYPGHSLPQLAEVPAPTPNADGQLLLHVRAAALKHFDRGQAQGTHYASPGAPAGPGRVLGGDAVGLLPDGTRVFALTAGRAGAMAEQTLIDPRRLVPVPAALADATAAALPNAVIGAGMALRFRAGLQAGDTVLINGATGFTGRVAVQLAKLYGAGRVVATGRNPASLQALRALGADEVLSVQQPDDDFVAHLKELHAARPFDVILDYLWGHSAELLLQALRGDGSFTHRVRLVSVGTALGDEVRLSGATLRSLDLHLTGSGLGSWSRQEVGQLFSQLLPEAFAWAAASRLHIETTPLPLADIARLGSLDVPAGQPWLA